MEIETTLIISGSIIAYTGVGAFIAGSYRKEDWDSFNLLWYTFLCLLFWPLIGLKYPISLTIKFYSWIFSLGTKKKINLPTAVALAKKNDSKAGSGSWD